MTGAISSSTRIHSSWGDCGPDGIGGGSLALVDSLRTRWAPRRATDPQDFGIGFSTRERLVGRSPRLLPSRFAADPLPERESVARLAEPSPLLGPPELRGASLRPRDSGLPDDVRFGGRALDGDRREAPPPGAATPSARRRPQPGDAPGDLSSMRAAQASIRRTGPPPALPPFEAAATARGGLPAPSERYWLQSPAGGRVDVPPQPSSQTQTSQDATAAAGARPHHGAVGNGGGGVTWGAGAHRGNDISMGSGSGGGGQHSGGGGGGGGVGASAAFATPGDDDETVGLASSWDRSVNARRL